jgi:hypothetical protein
MKFIVVIILLYLVITFLNWFTKFLTGDGKGNRQGDERQKKFSEMLQHQAGKQLFFLH